MSGETTILVVNPGSTSTKAALFKGTERLAAETISHPADILKQFPAIWEQYDFRLQAIRGWFAEHRCPLDAVVGMGGLLKPLSCGTYRVNDAMLRDARSNLQGEHASNLGCALAWELAQEAACPAFVVDPVSVDELEPLARYSGHPLIERKPLAHVLNIHAAARRAAEELGISVETSSFIVAHLGGGITVSPVKNNRMIDVNDASADGPFTPERTGGLPLQQFIGLCYSGKFTEQEMRKLIMGRGGLNAYLGTNSAKDVEERIAAGDTKAKEVYEAMAYQISKEIGAMATVLRGNIDALVLTGGLAGSKLLVGLITDRVGFLGRTLVYPGEDEMRSLAMGALRVLKGEEREQTY